MFKNSNYIYCFSSKLSFPLPPEYLSVTTSSVNSQISLVSSKFSFLLPPEYLSVTTSSINAQISLVRCPPLALCDIDPRNWNYCDLIRIPTHPLKNSTSIIECPTPPAESLEGPPKTEEEKISQQVFISSVTIVFSLRFTLLWGLALAIKTKCGTLYHLTAVLTRPDTI